MSQPELPSAVVDGKLPANVPLKPASALDTPQQSPFEHQRLLSCATFTKAEAISVATYLFDCLGEHFHGHAQKLDSVVTAFTQLEAMSSTAGYLRKELLLIYRFFKVTQAVLEPKGSGSADLNHVQKMWLVARLMKWQCRAMLNIQIKLGLNERFLKALGYIGEGGSRGNAYNLEASFGLDPVHMLGSNLHLGVSKSLRLTPAGQVSDTCRLKGGVGFSALCGLVSMDLQIGLLSGTKYPSLEAYANDNSHSLKAWFNESKLQVLENFSDLLKLTACYERDMYYCQASYPLLLESLRAWKLPMAGSLFFSAGFQGPTEEEVGTLTSLSAEVGMSGLIALKAGVKGCRETGTKRKRLNLIELFNLNPALAIAQISRLPVQYETGEQLLAAMQEHVITTSLMLVRGIAQHDMPGTVREKLHHITTSSRALLVSYLQLKAAHALGDECDRNLRALIADHAFIFRSAKLREYVLLADFSRSTASATINVSTEVGLVGQAGVAVHLNAVHKSDDFYAMGDYLELEVRGILGTLEQISKAVNLAVMTLGNVTFDVGSVVAQVGAAFIHQSHGAMSRALFRVGQGQVTLLMTESFLCVESQSGSSLPAVSVNLSFESSASIRYANSYWLGSESLSFILPIARCRLNRRGDSAWWDNFVKDHQGEFDQLLINMTKPTEHPGLANELAEMCRKVPTMSAFVQHLSDPDGLASAERLTTLREALQVYIEGYYAIEVARHWRLG